MTTVFEIARDVTLDGMSKKDAEELTRRVFSTVELLLENGEAVALPGLGKFKVADIAARKYRNPKTGEAVEKPARRKLVFVRTRGQNELR